MQEEVVEHETCQPQHWTSKDQTTDCQQEISCLQLWFQQSQQRRSCNIYKSIQQVVDDHFYFGVLSFDVEKGEREDDSDDCSVQKLKPPGWAEVGLNHMCPGRPQQPEDAEGYGAVGAQYEEEGVAEDVAGDGAEFVEEVDCCGEAGGHLIYMGERSAQAAAVVHQGPGNVKEGERHG